MLMTIKLFLALTLSGYLVGCDTDSSSGDRTSDSGDISTQGVKITTSGGSGSANSNFSLRITDALQFFGVQNVSVLVTDTSFLKP